MSRKQAQPAAAELADGDLELVLDSLDHAIELQETVWLKDSRNTWKERRQIKAQIARIWRLIERLVVYAPGHHMAFCVPQSDQIADGATGSSARLDEYLIKFGIREKPKAGRRAGRERQVLRNVANVVSAHEFKPLTRNGAANYPPVTARTSHVGRSPRSGGRESR